MCNRPHKLEPSFHTYHIESICSQSKIKWISIVPIINLHKHNFLSVLHLVSTCCFEWPGGLPLTSFQRLCDCKKSLLDVTSMSFGTPLFCQDFNPQRLLVIVLFFQAALSYWHTTIPCNNLRFIRRWSGPGDIQSPRITPIHRVSIHFIQWMLALSFRVRVSINCFLLPTKSSLHQRGWAGPYSKDPWKRILIGNRI